MTALTETTQERIRELFSPGHHVEVAEILERECGNNLPFMEKADASRLERLQLAALTLSQGDMGKLREAVELAKTDWRDLLVAASKAEAPASKKWWQSLWPRR
jgi:hypothetical protein